jgi:hypothetical protein
MSKLEIFFQSSRDNLLKIYSLEYIRATQIV